MRLPGLLIILALLEARVIVSQLIIPQSDNQNEFNEKVQPQAVVPYNFENVNLRTEDAPNIENGVFPVSLNPESPYPPQNPCQPINPWPPQNPCQPIKPWTPQIPEQPIDPWPPQYPCQPINPLPLQNPCQPINPWPPQNPCPPSYPQYPYPPVFPPYPPQVTAPRPSNQSPAYYVNGGQNRNEQIVQKSSEQKSDAQPSDKQNPEQKNNTGRRILERPIQYLRRKSMHRGDLVNSSSEQGESNNTGKRRQKGSPYSVQKGRYYGAYDPYAIQSSLSSRQYGAQYAGQYPSGQYSGTQYKGKYKYRDGQNSGAQYGGRNAGGQNSGVQYGGRNAGIQNSDVQYSGQYSDKPNSDVQNSEKYPNGQQNSHLPYLP